MLSIILGAVGAFVFGAVWYTFLFGKMWAKEMNFPPQSVEEAKKMGMVKPMAMNFVVNLIAAGVLYWLLPVVLPLSSADFIKAVIIIWVGFSLPILANAVIWERKTWKLLAINAVHGLLFYGILAAIIYAMN